MSESLAVAFNGCTFHPSIHSLYHSFPSSFYPTNQPSFHSSNLNDPTFNSISLSTNLSVSTNFFFRSWLILMKFEYKEIAHSLFHFNYLSMELGLRIEIKDCNLKNIKWEGQRWKKGHSNFSSWHPERLQRKEWHQLMDGWMVDAGMS